MSRLNNIERSIEELRVTTTAALDRRILSDAFAALEESMRIEWAGIRPSVWQLIVRSRITKLAAAAVIVIVVLVGVEFITRPGPKPQGPPITVVQAEKKQIEAMAAGGDIDGLVTMLSEGQFASKVLAAKYLGEIGDERALAELEKSYLLAEEQLPEGYTENPFAEPIEKIKSRIEPEHGEGVPGVDANEATVVDVNETAGVDANGRVVGGVSEIVGANVPAEREGVLDFFVVHKESNEPMAGVKLDIRIQREGPDDDREALTNQQGLCRIEVGDLKTNYISINVRKKAFVPTEVRFRKDKEAVRIDVPKRYTLLLEPGTPIGGFVRNEQSEPVEAATVYMGAWGSEKSEIERVSISDHKEKTDADGFWRCDIMPTKLGYIQIRLTHPNYIDDESYHARTAPSIEELRQMTSVMVMAKGVDVVGRVVDSNGQPIAKAIVERRQESASGAWWYRGGAGAIKYPRTETDAKGRFEFRNTKPGQVFLTVQAKGYAPDMTETIVHEGMRPLEFRLGPAQTIRGRAVDSEDKAIEGVEVSLDCWHGRQTIRWETKTDTEGFFEWNEAPKDEMKFAFSKEGYRPIRFLDMSPEVDEHIIVMYRPLRVSGKVVDAHSNELITEFKLIRGTKSGDDSPTHWDRSSATTFTGGRYEAEFIWRWGFRGSYVIRLEANDYVPGISRALTEEENVVIDFKLEKGEGPRGTVYLPNGEPAAGAAVALSTPRPSVFIRDGQLRDDKWWQSLTTGADGRFSFPPQIDRYLAVVVHDEGYAEVTDEELAAEPNIMIEPWGRVEGVLRVGGRALAGESVWLDRYTDYQQDMPRVSKHYDTVRTDANGSFAWERIVPGKVKISHLSRLGGVRVTWTRPEIIEVLPGETVNVTIGGSGRAVTGRFVAADPNEPIVWSTGQVGLDLKLSEPARPNDFEEMIFVERRRWNDRWRKQTEEGRLYKKMEWEQGRSYRAKIEPDGTFRVEDVPAGAYELRVGLGGKPGGKVVWGARKPVPPPDYDFEVPDVNDRYGDEPLDLGVIELKIRKPLKVGDFAPLFEAETFYGKKITLAEHRGNAVVLTFWTSERAEIMSHLGGLIKACSILEASERFVALGLSLDRDIEAAKKFAKDNELKWTNCFPSPGARVKVSDDYEIWKFPMTFVIGPDGRILAIDPSPLLLKSTVEEALWIK